MAIFLAYFPGKYFPHYTFRGGKKYQFLKGEGFCAAEEEEQVI